MSITPKNRTAFIFVDGHAEMLNGSLSCHMTGLVLSTNCCGRSVLITGSIDFSVTAEFFFAVLEIPDLYDLR